MWPARSSSWPRCTGKGASIDGAALGCRRPFPSRGGPGSSLPGRPGSDVLGPRPAQPGPGGFDVHGRAGHRRREVPRGLDGVSWQSRCGGCCLASTGHVPSGCTTRSVERAARDPFHAPHRIPDRRPASASMGRSTGSTSAWTCPTGIWSFSGCDPAWQRQGHGSALLAPVLQRADEEGVRPISRRRSRRTCPGTAGMDSRSCRRLPPVGVRGCGPCVEIPGNQIPRLGCRETSSWIPHASWDSRR